MLTVSIRTDERRRRSRKSTLGHVWGGKAPAGRIRNRVRASGRRARVVRVLERDGTLAGYAVMVCERRRQ